MGNTQKPIILLDNENTVEDLDNLRAEFRIFKESDIFESQLKELFQITYPEVLFSDNYNLELDKFLKVRIAQNGKKLVGNWIYFPWSGRLVHSLSEKEYVALRTNRNRNLITLEEQKTLENFTVGLVGLSVGSNVATALAYSGISKRMKIAEFDLLETSNLNRIRARIDQIGLPKIDITTEQIYEINPYADLTLFSEGLDNKKLLEDFVKSEPKLRLIFEIIDSFDTKIYLRTLARESKIPVIMVTNLGDRVIIDLERYDLDQSTEFFNGRAGTIPHDILESPDVSVELKHKYAVELAGVKNIPQRALESVEQIGKTLVGRPQLTTTVTVAAGFCAYLTRKIALGEQLGSCSWLIKFDDIFDISNGFN